MTSDPLQEAWQSQPPPAVDIDRLVEEFRRGQQQFAALIFRRDVGEVVVGLLLLPVWIGMGVGMGLPWTWYLGMPGIAWIVVFLMVDRWRQRRRRALPDDPLVRGVESSLREVEHQIWLLRNVHWWYLLPPALPMLAFVADVSWRASRGNLWETIIVASLATAVFGGAFTWIYWINQKAVRSTLEPRRRELAALLRSLSDDPPRA